MDFLSILSLANSIEGGYLGIGYGRGEHIKEITKFLKLNQIPKRQFTFFDDFKKYPYGSAYDYRLDNPIAEHRNIKKPYYKISSVLKEPIAILVINVDDVKTVKTVLDKAFKKLVTKGILYIPQYGSNVEITELVNEYLDSKNLLLFGGREDNVFEKLDPYVLAVKPKVGRFSNPPKDIQAKKPKKQPLPPFESKVKKKPKGNITKPPKLKPNVKLVESKVRK